MMQKSNLVPRLMAFVLTLCLGLSGLAAAPAIAANPSPTAISSPVPLYDNLGNHHYAIATPSVQTQRYFDQGLRLAYGFNHAEAARAFQAGITTDDTCAMCYWGLAYVLGPNINAPMDWETIRPAWQAIRQAQTLSSHAPPKEQALIQALATRYTADPDADRDRLNQVYAEAMGRVHQQYPQDPEIATLYAEALMDTMPWDYWDAAGNPNPDTEVVLATLEAVLADYPTHIGALHLYIHAVEKAHPDWAEAAADTLRSLVPGSGHLVHMPSHIYIRVGRYHDAVVANQAAIAADNTYLQGPYVPSIYTFAYVPHNYHFQWFGALMTGQGALALDAAHQTAQVDTTMMRDPDLAGSLQHYYAIPLYTLIRFERWQDILATPAPEPDLKYPTGVWNYAQGMALAAQGKSDLAQQHLADLNDLIAEPDLAEQTIWGFNTTRQVLQIAASVLTGEIALAKGDHDQGIDQLRQAVELEDQLVYTEPPDWYAPTRNLLGQALLIAGRYPEAAAAFQADLAKYPENGWSLSGLADSLQAQGKTEEAAAVQARFETAWQYADV